MDCRNCLPFTNATSSRPVPITEGPVPGVSRKPSSGIGSESHIVRVLGRVGVSIAGDLNRLILVYFDDVRVTILSSNLPFRAVIHAIRHHMDHASHASLNTMHRHCVTYICSRSESAQSRRGPGHTTSKTSTTRTFHHLYLGIRAYGGSNKTSASTANIFDGEGQVIGIAH